MELMRRRCKTLWRGLAVVNSALASSGGGGSEMVLAARKTLAFCGRGMKEAARARRR